MKKIVPYFVLDDHWGGGGEGSDTYIIVFYLKLNNTLGIGYWGVHKGVVIFFYVSHTATDPLILLRP